MHDFTWFGWFSDKINHHNIHIYTAAFVAALIILAAFVYNKGLKSIDEEVVPEGSFTLKNLFQVIVEWILNLMESIIGPDAKDYFPVIGALFIYIFLNNLMGIVPGFVPATDNINTTLALGVTVFIYYNFMGIKKNGFVAYAKHFMGPIVWMAPLMLIIELISHAVRPLSLGIRLFGNMTGDHVVLGIFSGLVPLFIPIIFMALGIFVSFVQAFVFSLLSSVYIGLAVAHEDHDDHGHHDEAHHGEAAQAHS